MFYDKGITNDYNSNWYRSGSLRKTVTDEYTLLEEVTDTGNSYYPTDGNGTTIDDIILMKVPFAVSFSLLECTDPRIRFSIPGDTTYINYVQLNGNKDYTFIMRDDGLYKYVDGVETQVSSTTPPKQMSVGFITTTDNTLSSVKYKDFVIYEIGE